MLLVVSEALPRVDEAQVVDILYVAFLALDPKCVLLGQELQRIKSLSLRFGNRRDVIGSRQGLEPGEVTASKLNYHPAI